MATALHSAIEFAFDPLISSNLATNTALGTSTRHDFAAITLYIPETLVGATPFRSVHVEITVRGQYATSARQITGWLIGIKLGAVAFSDASNTPASLTNSGETYTFRFTRDVTDYFNANWTGTSMTAQVGVVFATNVADEVGNITAKIIIGAYDYDDTSTTYIQTARIPIQSVATLLSTVKTEIGTSGTNPAPANQIPALNTFLPEASKVYRRAWIEIIANDGTTGTTNFNLFVEIDSAGESTRATLVCALNTAAYFCDHFIYDTSTHDPATAHSFNLRASSANRFPLIGAILHVTYEYDNSTTTTWLQSVKGMLCSCDLGSQMPGTTAADGMVYAFTFYVEEPATITMLQSGFVMFLGSNAAPSPFGVQNGSGTIRTYTPTISIIDAQMPFVNRTDINGDWALIRGSNRLTFMVYNTISSDNIGIAGGYVILNYTSGEAAGGKSTHNRTSVWAVCDYKDTGAVTGIREIAAASQRTPGGLGTNYKVNFYGQDRLWGWGSAVTSAEQTDITMYEIEPGEFDGSGWYPWTSWYYTNEETGQHDVTLSLLPAFNSDSYQSDAMDIQTARRYRLGAGGANAAWGAAYNWLTHNEITFTVSGTVSGYSAGDGSGLTVNAWNDTLGRKIGSAVTAVGGTFSIPTFDNVDTYFEECRENSTHVGRSDNDTPS